MIEFYDALRSLMPSTVTTRLFSAELSNPPAISDYPYLVIEGDQGAEASGSGVDIPSLSDKPDKVVVTARLLYVGLTPRQLSIVTDNARAALKAGAPTVDGYRVHLSRPTVLQTIEVDRDVSVESLNPLIARDEAILTAHKL